MGNISFTNDLSMFHLIPGNRKISPRKVKNLVAAILEENNLEDWPIYTQSDGGIVDGQHRWAAVKLLQDSGQDIGIYYQQKETNIHRIAKANLQVTRWTVRDWMEYAVTNGSFDVSYAWAKEVATRYPKASMTSIIMIGSGQDYKYRNSTIASFYDGSWRMTDKEHLETVLSIAEVARVARFRSPFDFRFLLAISVVSKLPGFNLNHMLMNLTRASETLQPRTTIDGHVRQLVAVYNYMTRVPNRLYLPDMYRGG